MRTRSLQNNVENQRIRLKILKFIASMVQCILLPQTQRESLFSDPVVQPRTCTVQIILSPECERASSPNPQTKAPTTLTLMFVLLRVFSTPAIILSRHELSDTTHNDTTSTLYLERQTSLLPRRCMSSAKKEVYG